MNRPFWLGVIGCVFGFMLVFCGVILLFIGDVISGIGTTHAGSYGNVILPNIILTGIFSALGLAASLLDTRKRLGGALMIVAAIGISLSFFPFGFIPALFFLLGGILKLMERQKMINPVPQQVAGNTNMQK